MTQERKPLSGRSRGFIGASPASALLVHASPRTVPFPLSRIIYGQVGQSALPVRATRDCRALQAVGNHCAARDTRGRPEGALFHAMEGVTARGTDADGGACAGTATAPRRAASNRRTINRAWRRYSSAGTSHTARGGDATRRCRALRGYTGRLQNTARKFSAGGSSSAAASRRS